MKPKQYFLSAIILLVILGIFLTLGIVNSRRNMMELIKEQARSFLSIVASTQENSIFAEGEYEDEIIEKGTGLWKHGKGTFSDKPSYDAYRSLKELKADIENVNLSIASMPEYSEVRLRAIEYH